MFTWLATSNISRLVLAISYWIITPCAYARVKAISCVVEDTKIAKSPKAIVPSTVPTMNMHVLSAHSLVCVGKGRQQHMLQYVYS